MTKRLLLPLFVFTAVALLADTLELKDGRSVRGTYLGGNARQVRMEVGDNIQAFEISDVKEIRFGGAVSATPAAAAANRATPASRTYDAARRGFTIPNGSQVTIRMIDAIDSESANLGDTFQASIDEPILVNGTTVIPRGADVVVKLIEDKQSGKLAGRTELGLAIQSIKVDGRAVDISTEQVTQASSSRTARSGKVIGGTAAAGAIIGAIAGGGKGAAIGTVAGAGAGTAAQAVTKGQRVKIPSETRLTFTLSQAVEL